MKGGSGNPSPSIENGGSLPQTTWMKLKISQREKNLLTVLALLLVGLFFSHFIYQPQSLALAQLRNQLEEKTLEYKEIRQLLEEKKAWEQESAESGQLSLPNLLEQANDLALASKVEIRSFRPQEQTTQAGDNTGGKQAVFQLTVEGNFAALESFLNSWERSIKSGVITSLEIVPAQEPSLLQANLVVKALLLQEE